MERERGGGHRSRRFVFFSFSPWRTPSHPVYIHSRYTRTRPSSVFIADKQRVYWPWDALSLSLSPFFGSTFFFYLRWAISKKNCNYRTWLFTHEYEWEKFSSRGESLFLYLRKKKNLGNWLEPNKKKKIFLLLTRIY
jgi:hypothetical protein